MASTQTIETHKENVEIYHGDEICKEKSLELLREIDMPNGLLPLKDILEVGYNRTTGFVWLKQKKAITHVFKSIGKNVSYAQEISAFVQNHRLKKVTGVKSRELLIWVTISDIFIDLKNSERIVFRTPAGMSRAFPVSAFVVNEEVEKKKNDEEVEKKNDEEVEKKKNDEEVEKKENDVEEVEKKENDVEEVEKK
ncbi:plant/protein (Protein of unknown function, DUF538) [Thalictrum thalictroides]|uniref:DUF538 family protein n=1 Tax=Thalictrum thalictroides TaxID=46969 RepID=A0A7J6W345_THATH|nr:plant/protein (Protein of unknown function, DUF538) [Thalictrum thalictroides]